MTRTPAIFFALLVTAAAVPSAKAGGTINIKCAPNEDRVWVYESLVDFNVAAKLKCGDPVQIVERVKGYVKIETASGTEGYVLDTSFPKSALPPAPPEKPNDVESAAAAFAARRGRALRTIQLARPASANSGAPATVAERRSCRSRCETGSAQPACTAARRHAVSRSISQRSERASPNCASGNTADNVTRAGDRQELKFCAEHKCHRRREYRAGRARTCCLQAPERAPAPQPVLRPRHSLRQ